MVASAHEEKGKKQNVVHRTETQYSTLFPYWNREFRIDFDGAEDLIVVDVWDWDAGKNTLKLLKTLKTYITRALVLHGIIHTRGLNFENLCQGKKTTG